MSATPSPAEPCLAAREWLSANRDGEAFDDPEQRGHLAGCPECAAWTARFDALTPRMRVRATGGTPDVIGPALAAWRARDAAAPERQAVVARVLLAVAGVTAIALAALGAAGVSTNIAAAGHHIGWELAAFEAALGIGFCFAAARPDRYGRSLLPVTVAAVVLTLQPLAMDLSRAAVDPLTEASHVPTLVGLAALLLLVDAARRRGAPQRHSDRQAHA